MFAVLNIIEAGQISARQKWIEEFRSETSTWIVSDLTYKKELQNFYLLRDGHLTEDACLRAREFWQKLLQRSSSPLRVVSADLIKILLSDWLKEREISWASGGTSADILYSYLEHFVPVLVREESYDLLRSWLKDQPVSLMKWGAWFELSCEAWQFLQKQKLISTSFVAPILNSMIEEEGLQLNWRRPIFFDLGVQISAAEVQLIGHLAKILDVTVFAPERFQTDEYASTLWPYKLLRNESINLQVRSQLKPVEKAVQCFQLPTRLAEVQFAVARVREWLDKDVSPSSISIYCRDPEVYWPALLSHLEEEGIPFDKDVVAGLASFPVLLRWLSGMRSHLHEVRSEDLESWIFAEGSEPVVSYDRFRVFLSRVYEEQDLGFLPQIGRDRAKILSGSKRLSRDVFVIWALPFFPDNEDLGALEPVMSRLISECPAEQMLPLSQWMAAAEKIVTKSELLLEKGLADGIKIKKFDSSVWEKNPFRILMGLTQSDLVDVPTTAISLGEIQKLGADLGFFLQFQDPRVSEYLVIDNLRSAGDQTLMLFPLHDFSGDPQSPASVWSVNEMRFGRSVQEFSNEKLTRWQQRQLEVPDDQFQHLLNIDRGMTVPSPMPLEKRHTLSASQLENLAECSFKYFAKRGLRLADEPELIMDMDRVRRGRLTHKLFELIIQKGLDQNWSPTALEEVVELAVREENMPIFKTFWTFQKQRLVRLGVAFIEFERGWRKKFSGTVSVSTELKFSGKLFDFEFKGSIDRVDRTPDGDYIVIDYKSSLASVSQFKNWMSRGEFQLFLYTYAIENGWTSLAPGKCVGAVYYDIKTFHRATGFLRKDIENPYYEISGRSGAAITHEALEELKSSCLLKIKEHCEQITEGRFLAKPTDPEDACPKCTWKMLCRAPHLNV